ncbi:MAG TPA: alpha/beta hydrolase, partial [Phycicoccus sp.]|nr:alpha/beta hydrolase [Phycicoccus sp.]
MTIARGLVGLLALGVAIWVWATRGDVLLAGHPAYPILTGLVGVIGLVMIAGMILRRRVVDPARRGRRLRLAGRIVGLLGVALLAVMTAWLRPFAATADAAALMGGTNAVAVESDWSTVTLTPRDKTQGVGLIFQPGARVDPRAYLPLLTRVAEAGHLVVIVKQPLDLGLMAIGAPSGIVAGHPEVRTWVVGGHSLGGVAASPLLLSVASRPVWAQGGMCTPSALASANLSGQHGFTGCGISAGFWKTKKNWWPTPSNTAFHSIFPKIRYNNIIIHELNTFGGPTTLGDV